jgi:hypothetical protein
MQEETIKRTASYLLIFTDVDIVIMYLIYAWEEMKEQVGLKNCCLVKIFCHAGSSKGLEIEIYRSLKIKHSISCVSCLACRFRGKE